jgi:nitrate/TMAO reductase-like tetraheme cytochrome c subunit
MTKAKSRKPSSPANLPSLRLFWNNWRRFIGGVFGFMGLLLLPILLTEYESYNSVYDAGYVGSETCGSCHTLNYAQWQTSPHANMTHEPSPQTVVGNFDDGAYYLPEHFRASPLDDLPAARMYQENGRYYMALRQPDSDQYVPFPIDYVIGYQYRQTYLTEEAGGVLRRLPLQWSVPRQEFFAYWNYQEGIDESLEDFWEQMTTLNSAWNLFCARCHVTNLEILDRNPQHTYAVTQWTDNGIGCESCHGPGSHHVNYFANNYVNRVAAFANSKLRGEPVAYIVRPSRLEEGADLSVCAQCHGPDITVHTTEIYRIYEPGYSGEGRINDLSLYFQQVPLEPGRTAPTVETWHNGRPKGIAMIFRSFIESDHYQTAGVRCYDCHNPHNNKAGAAPGILQASAVSNQYCLDCHVELSNQIAEHTRHEPGTSGSFCYDCHMPFEIINLASGTPNRTRTHWMSSAPDPLSSAVWGVDRAPNACNECHTDQTPEWSAEWMATWWPGSLDMPVPPVEEQ